MVNRLSLENRVLARVMSVGSRAGALLSLLGVLVLASVGEPLQPWTFSFLGWWQGDHGFFRFVTGLGVLILMATPVAMLLTFAAQMIHARRVGPLLTVFSLLLVLAAGLILNLASGFCRAGS